MNEDTMTGQTQRTLGSNKESAQRYCRLRVYTPSSCASASRHQGLYTSEEDWGKLHGDVLVQSVGHRASVVRLTFAVQHHPPF